MSKLWNKIKGVIFGKFKCPSCSKVMPVVKFNKCGLFKCGECCHEWFFCLVCDGIEFTIAEEYVKNDRVVAFLIKCNYCGATRMEDRR